ncbi:MAG TPA: hypothetical protein VGO45_03445 [Bacteroidia bacterium]|jgi:hypothetical protein|nr:hypothetical protein [Bacteroidia bacterium]
MKKFILGTLSFLAIAVFTAFQTTDGNSCETKVLKEKARKSLDPYRYDSSKLIKISCRKQSFMKEVEVPLFIGEKYKFVFNTEALTKPVIIDIYNKDHDARNRKLLYSTKDDAAGKGEHIWEYARSTKVYVDYTIPAGGDSSSFAGCLLFVLGYK